MTSALIKKVDGLRVWDSRGRPTIEAVVELESGAIGRAIAPAGASMGAGEALDKRDGGTVFGGYDVTAALSGLRNEIAPALRGRRAADQAQIDCALIELDGTPDKSRLGGNALIAVSMAVAHAAAQAGGVPLWRHLLGDEPPLLPLPEIQIFGGGAHAGRRVDIQDFMVTAIGAADYTQALDWTAEVYRAAGELMAAEGRLQGVADEGGYWPNFENNEQALGLLVKSIERARLIPGTDVAISLDIAASQFRRAGRYRLAKDQRDMDSDELIEMLVQWLDRYPIVSIEDPVAEDDPEGFARFTAAVGHRIQVVGDDFLVTNTTKVEAAISDKSCNTLLVKPNQAGTLTETRSALEAARKGGMGAIISARSGETEDVTLVHLAVGWGVRQLKVGSFTRSERMAKWNEGLRICHETGGRGEFCRGHTFPWTGRETSPR
jgi:enolase